MTAKISKPLRKSDKPNKWRWSLTFSSSRMKASISVPPDCWAGVTVTGGAVVVVAVFTPVLLVFVNPRSNCGNCCEKLVAVEGMWALLPFSLPACPNKPGAGACAGLWPGVHAAEDFWMVVDGGTWTTEPLKDFVKRVGCWGVDTVGWIWSRPDGALFTVLMALALLGFVVIKLLAVEEFAPCWNTVDGFSSTLSIFSSDKLLLCALTGFSSPGLPASCKKTPHKGLAGYILPFLIPAYIQSPSTKTKVLKTIMEVIFQSTNTFLATAALSYNLLSQVQSCC